jgi:hypothetical protein
LKTPFNPQADETRVQIDNSGDGVIRFGRSQRRINVGLDCENVKFGFQQTAQAIQQQDVVPHEETTFECGQNRLLCIRS